MNQNDPAPITPSYDPHGHLAKVSGLTLRPGGLSITRRALEFCAFGQGAKIVDAGCGPGETLKLLRDLGFEASGVDPDQRYVEMAGKFGPAVKGTLESLSLSAQNADGVFCECALNLSSDRLGSLSEIYKVLKPGGHFVLADIFTLGLDPKNPPPPQNTAPSCVGGAVTLTEARWQIESLGFEIKLTEDYAPALNALAAKLVWTYGQRGLAFLPTPKRDCAVGEKPPKLTYALLISQKPEGPFCP